MTSEREILSMERAWNEIAEELAEICRYEGLSDEQKRLVFQIWKKELFPELVKKEEEASK